MRFRKFLAIAFLTVICITLFLGAKAVPSSYTNDSLAGLWKDVRSFPESRSLLEAVFAHFNVNDSLITGTDFIWDDLAYTRESNVGPEELDESFTLLFASYLSKNELEYLRDRFECVPIAYDALVFVNNANNVVANMSRDQLQGVYTGKITNWDQIGGADETIKAYQRPHYSDSQAMFEDMLLQGRKGIPALEKWVYACLEAADVVEGYDNGLYSLGYSRFFYLNRIYSRDRIRMIAVDGIEPNPQTIATHQYPFSAPVYAVYSRNLTAEHPARKLIDWLLGFDGQKLIENAGYIPMENVEQIPKETDNAPLPLTMESSGSGGQFNHSTDTLEYLELHWGYTDERRGEWLKGREISVTMPSNPSLERDINAWCNEARENLAHISGMNNDDTAVSEFANRVGNLLSFYFEVGYGKNTVIRTAVFDIHKGEKLKLSDLFLDGFNYIDYINTEAIKMMLGNDTVFSGEFSCVEENLLHVFRGFPSDYPYFVVAGNALYLAFQADNSFFDVPITNPQMLIMGGIPLWHDVSPWGGCKIEIRRLAKYTEETHFPILFIPSLRIDDGQFPAAEQAINQRLADICAACPDFTCYPDMYEISPDFGIIRQYLSVCFPVSMVSGGTITNLPNLGGLIIDLHTGMPMFSKKQIMAFTQLSTTKFFIQDAPWSTFTPMDGKNPLLVPGDYSIGSMWLKEEPSQVTLTVEMHNDGGEVIRMVVPLQTALANQEEASRFRPLD